jgi:site-specific DNA-methyltransferase (adenine-specific)
MNRVVLSRGRDDWGTPPDLFAALNAEFGFTLDPCALPDTALCARYFTPDDDGLAKSWAGHVVFCNPPYSKLRAWVAKALRESQQPDTTVVMLIPARTDTYAFHDYILDRAEIRFVRGRLRFVGAVNGAPFPSAVVIFGRDGVSAIWPDGSPALQAETA